MSVCYSISLDINQHEVYIADTNNHFIRKIFEISKPSGTPTSAPSSTHSSSSSSSTHRATRTITLSFATLLSIATFVGAWFRLQLIYYFIERYDPKFVYVRYNPASSNDTPAVIAGLGPATPIYLAPPCHTIGVAGPSPAMTSPRRAIARSDHGRATVAARLSSGGGRPKSFAGLTLYMRSSSRWVMPWARKPRAVSTRQSVG